MGGWRGGGLKEVGGVFLMKHREILGGVVCGVCDEDTAFDLCSVAVFNWSLTYLVN